MQWFASSWAKVDLIVSHFKVPGFLFNGELCFGLLRNLNAHTFVVNFPIYPFNRRHRSQTGSAAEECAFNHLLIDVSEESKTLSDPRHISLLGFTNIQRRALCYHRIYYVEPSET